MSLPADDPRQALAPAGNIIVQQWGVLGTLARIGGFARAILAWHLDRDDYRALAAALRAGGADGSEASSESATASSGEKRAEPPYDESCAVQRTDDGLDVKRVSPITSVIALLGPMIASRCSPRCSHCFLC